MPEISRFFGIVIRMYAEIGGVHHRPHVHAYYGENVGAYAIDVVEVIGGGLPRKQERLVLAWTEIHREALLENWQALRQGRPPRPVPPLK